MVNVSACNTTTIFDVKMGYLFNIFLQDDHYNLEEITEKEPVQRKRSYSTTPNLNRKKSTNFSKLNNAQIE